MLHFNHTWVDDIGVHCTQNHEARFLIQLPWQPERTS